MIINFSNLGGGGGGYTLPTATASRLGGVMIGSGITVDSAGTISAQEYTLPTASSEVLGGIKVGSGLTITDGVLSTHGGSDANAQHRFTAATTSDMESLTGVSEGDICVIPSSHTETEATSFYESINNGNNVWDAMGSQFNTGSDSIKFTFQDNPYYDSSQYVSDIDILFSFYNQYTSEGYCGWELYGQTPNAQEMYLQYEGTGLRDGWSAATSGDSVTFTRNQFNEGIATGGYSESVALFQPASHPENQYILVATVESDIQGATYQFNGGQWIQLASQSDISNLSSYISGVESQLYNKLNWYDTWVNDPSEMAYNDAWCHTHINNEDKGAYLVSGWWDETQQTQVYVQKRVAELTTSEDVMRIKKLTQAEYDALVSGGTVDSQTLYAIIPDPNA